MTKGESLHATQLDFGNIIESDLLRTMSQCLQHKSILIKNEIRSTESDESLLSLLLSLLLATYLAAANLIIYQWRTVGSFSTEHTLL